MAPVVIEADLNYHLDEAHGGFDSYYSATAGMFRARHDVRRVAITSIRDSDQEFTLDRQGFQLYNHDSAWKTLAEVTQHQQEVIKESEALVKAFTGASECHIFSTLTRHQDWEQEAKKAESEDDIAPASLNIPYRCIHSDVSYRGAQDLLENKFPPEVLENVTKSSHWAIINLWRPLDKPVERDPVAFCDWLSIQPEQDLVAVRAKLPPVNNKSHWYSKQDHWTQKTGGFETWASRYNPKHRWYFVDGMKPDEIVLFKLFDSRSSGCSRTVIHSAFVDSRHVKKTPRRSLEMRSLVLWH